MPLKKLVANAQNGAARAMGFRDLYHGAEGIESAELDQSGEVERADAGIGRGGQPIFDDGRICSPDELTKASYLRLLAQYEQTIQTAFREVSDALIGYQKSREQRSSKSSWSRPSRTAWRSPIGVFSGVSIATCRYSMPNGICLMRN